MTLQWGSNRVPSARTMQDDAATNSCYVQLRRQTTGDLSAVSVKYKLSCDYKFG
jgi:hypothetical protein